MANGWIGVDLDGTLAEYDVWEGAEFIGKPIEPMIARVNQWLKRGDDVRIFTARVSMPTNNAKGQLEAARAILAIQAFCTKHFGRALPITCTKDYQMIELWDDRAIQVERNKGRRIDGEN